MERESSDDQYVKKKLKKTEREWTAALFLLRAVQLGLTMKDLNEVTVGMVLDMYLGSFTQKKKICILSDHYQKIQSFIIKDMDRGVTVYHVQGGYDGKERCELVAVMDKSEYGHLLDYMAKEDPKAFITVSDINKVVGTWNTANRRSYF